MRVHLTQENLRRQVYERRRGERPPVPTSLQEADALLLNPNWAHFGRSLDDTEQIYQGLVGDGPRASSLYVFLNILQLLSVTAHIFSDGTFKVVHGLKTIGVVQFLMVVASWNDRVCEMAALFGSNLSGERNSQNSM